MAILSTNQRLINVGDSYSAGNGIDITNNIISVTGDNAPYSAGDNIDIQDHIISGKDWSNDIEQASANAYNVTTAWVQDNYANSADMTYISAKVDTKLDTSAWSSVSGDLATESYVIMADNITYDRAKGYVDSKGYATEEFVNENTSGKLESTAFDTWRNGQYSTDLQTIEGQIANKLDSSSFAEVSGTFYPTSNPSGFITGVDLSNYYTKDETSGKEELANAFANIPVGDSEVNSYVHNNSASIGESTNLVQSNSSTWNDITAYQSNSASYQPSGNYIPYTAVNGGVIPSFKTNSGLEINTYKNGGLHSTFMDENTIQLRYVASSFREGSVLSNSDLTFENTNDSAYVDMEKIHTWDSASNYIQSISATYADVSTTVQTNSSTWNDVTAYQSNSANYLTAHQSLEGLMSASLLESADGKWTAYNSIPFKAGDEFPASADEAIQAYQTNSGLYLTAHQDISNKLDVSAFSDVSGTFLTAVDLTPYYTTAEADTLSSMLSGAIDYVSANVGGAGNPEVESYVQTNSANIDETVTSYQTNSGTFLTAHQAISAEEWNDCYDNVNTNSGAWGGTSLPISSRDGIDLEIDNNILYIGASALASDVANKLDTTAFSDVSGTFYPTTNPSSFVNEDWVTAQGYITGVSIPESATWQDVSTTVQTNSAQWAEGGSSDTFYIYPGKTTDKEISENSGKNLKLYNSANNVFLDFAGKSTLSNYTMFSFKEITGTQYNQNTLQHLRLRVYPNATSACKVYDTNTINLLDSNSTVSQAQTAYYDAGGYSLTQTRMNFDSLNSFVQSNSASWGQGGGSDVAPLGLWLGYEYSQPKVINNTNVPYGITLRNTEYDEPASVYYQGNEFRWNGTNGNWYIDLTTIYPNQYISDIPYNDENYIRFKVMEFTNQSTQDKYSANITIIGSDRYRNLTVNSTACIVSARGQYASFGVSYDDGTGGYQLSSWTARDEFYTSGVFSESQATALYLGADQEASTAFIGFVEAGSTVASGDIFPPTNNLDPYATYYLGWNANNGGLFWYNPSNGGN